MEIVNLEVEKLRPDPNQPRTIIDDAHVKELSASMIYDPKTGTAPKVINPIEVDEDGVIITGELRWRAAKLAGFKTIPAKIVDPGDEHDRFTRQTKENIHRNTMTEYDTMNAIKKLYKSVVAGDHVPDKYNPDKDEGIRTLARQIGKSHNFISEYLQLAEEPEEVKEALKKKQTRRTYIREANKAPEEFKKPLKDKILKGELANQEGIQSVAKALWRAPDKSEDLLEHDYKGKSREQIISYVNEVSPSPISQVKDATERARKVINLTNNLTVILVKTRIENVPPLMQPKLILAIEDLGKALKKLFANKNVKLLKD